MEITDILKKIDSLKKKAETLQLVKPELEKVFWDKFRLEFNYNSNHLEGNTLTYDHTQLLLLFDQITGDYSLRELEEMKAHDVAFKVTKEGALEMEHILTEQFIKEINKIILVRPFYKEAITPDGQPTRRQIEPGQYKKYPNSVRLENGEIFNYATPEVTPAMMGDLIEWYRKETDSKELHPVQLAALFHYRFVRIHPFDDGNGRTTRLLMNYMLIKNGIAPVVIESVDKKNYLTALNKADIGNIEAFVEYISKLALRWQKLYFKALNGEDIEERGDFKKDLNLLKKKVYNSKDKGEILLAPNIFFGLIRSTIKDIITEVMRNLEQFDELFLKTSIKLFQDNNLFGSKKELREVEINQDNLEDLLDFSTMSPFLRYVTKHDENISEQIFSFKYEHRQLKTSTHVNFNYVTSLIFFI